MIKKDYFYIDKTMFIKEWWESGFGRYDVMIEPRDKSRDAIILEFKVLNLNSRNKRELSGATKQKGVDG